MNHSALTVSEDLDLDVARPLEVPFEIDLAATEERGRLVLRDRQHVGELVAVMSDLHAATATACRRLYQNRIADRRSRGLGCRKIAHATRRARNRRDPEPADGVLGRH